MTAAEDPGVARELLATGATLGGVGVVAGSLDAVTMALASAGDWRFSRRWQLESWDPSDGARVVVTARAALAGWANEDGSRLVLHVGGGGFHAHEGVSGVPGLLHGYLLCVTRSGTGSDPIDAVYRVTLSCPGEFWCRRGGCTEQEIPEFDSLLLSLVEAGHAADAPATADDVREAYLNLYGDAGFSEYADVVLDVVETTLSRWGWVTLKRSMWEGGLEEVLLRRAEHCLTVTYDPVTRRLRPVDGKPELELTLDMLAEAACSPAMMAQSNWTLALRLSSAGAAIC